MGATNRKRFEPSPGMFQCSVCRRALAPEQFLPIKVRDKRCKPGHELACYSYDCRECRKRQRVERRRQKAEAAGKTFVPRGDKEVWLAQLKAEREKRKAERQAAWAFCCAMRKLVSLSHEELRRRANARITKRQRERRHTDPAYQAAIKARKIRRYRAQRDTQVVPINREVVAQRDGWLCGICGKQVTRETWSLDHVIPLSLGGSHTYDNIVLAHRICNIRRGVGRMPVQAPLFALPGTGRSGGADV